MWTFAGAVLLVGPLAATVAMAIYLHIYLRVWRRNRAPLHRVLFSTATILLAVQAAAAVTDRVGHGQLFRSVPGVVAVVAAMVVYMLVNLALVVLVIVVSGPIGGSRPCARRSVRSTTWRWSSPPSPWARSWPRPPARSARPTSCSGCRR